MNENKTYQEYILVDDDFFASLIKDINSATNFIDLETYIFSEKKLGKDIINALINAAARGVKIRVLVDGIGTLHWNNLQNQMNTKGILLKAYHPLFWSTFQLTKFESMKNIMHYLTHINSRNHRKTCVIDDKIAYIGSANLTEYGSHCKTNQEWHDITVKLIDFPLEELRYAYSKAWHCLTFNYGHKVKNYDSHLLLNYTWRKRRALYKLFLTMLGTAEQRIWLTNAYFVPRKFLLSKLIKASKRNVKIAIILPKNPDVIGMSLLMKSFYYKLLKSGVKILHYHTGILHTKFLIVDDWYCVGSINFNYRSFHYDLEADVILKSSSAKEKLEQQFKQYCCGSEEIILQHISKLSLLEKIGMKIMWMFRFLF